MAQGQFTKREARRVREVAEEILSALPRSKKLAYFGHFNDLFLFLETAERAAPHAFAGACPRESVGGRLDESPEPVAVTS